jgi:hypothetical protein
MYFILSLATPSLEDLFYTTYISFPKPFCGRLSTLCPGGELRNEASDILQAVHESSASSVLFTRQARGRRGGREGIGDMHGNVVAYLTRR